MPIADASNFAFFQLINDYLRDEINTFQWNLLTSTAQLVGAIGLMLLTVWMLFQGFRIVTGRTQQPMMALVGDALKATLIIGIATGAASVSSSLYWTLTDGTASAITSLVSRDSDNPYQSIDKNLAYMQAMLSTIDTLASGGDPSVDSAKDRAKWFSGIGIAGPGLVGGAILLINKIAIALFVGFGPLFIICLLFEQTKSLFSKWLLYGIGTVFSLAVLSFMVGLANNMVRSVAVAFLARYAALLAGGDGGIDGEGITSLALQQGGLGLILTILIVSAPSMAAAFFRGVLGQFQAHSPFGMLGRGGGAPLQRDSGYQSALTDTGYADARRVDTFGNVIGDSLARADNSGGSYDDPLGDPIKRNNGWAGVSVPGTASAWNSGSLPDLYDRTYGAGSRMTNANVSPADDVWPGRAPATRDPYIVDSHRDSQGLRYDDWNNTARTFEVPPRNMEPVTALPAMDPLPSFSGASASFESPQSLRSVGTNSEVQYSIGVSGTVFVPLTPLGVPAVGVGGGTAFGISTDGTLLGTSFFGQVQGNGMIGVGAFAGIGLAPGVSISDGPPTRGWSSSTSGYFEADAGLGVSVGLAGAIDNNANISGVSAGIPLKVIPGLGYGAAAGIGATTSTMYASPTVGDLLNGFQLTVSPGVKKP